MASLNKAIVMGNLGADPEVRYTANQTAVCTLNVATTDYKTNEAGEKQEFTEWHKVTAWGKTAENCSKYLTKGQSVLVEGRLKTDSYEKDGIKKYSTAIIANNVQFLGGKKPEQAAPAPGAF